MKKMMALLLSLALFLSLFAGVGMAAEAEFDDSHAFVFADAADAACWSASMADTSLEFGLLKLTITGQDPTLVCQFPEEMQFSAEEYPFVAYRYRAECTLDTGIFYVTSTNYPDFSDMGMTEIPVDNSGEWKDAVIKMSRNLYWRDTITSFRLDPINGAQTDEGAVIYIDRIGFFKTREEAKAFLAASSGPDMGTAVTLRGGMAKAFAPSGTLSEDYAAADYLPAAPDAAPADALACVETDEGARIVPVSYVNSVGFLSYMAETPGTYRAVVPEGNEEKEEWPEEWRFVIRRGVMTEADCAAEAMTRGQFAGALKKTMLCPPQNDLFSPAEPDAPLTMADAAEMTGEYLNLVGAEPFVNEAFLPADCELSEAGKLACGSGVMAVTDGKLFPERILSGDEAAAVLRRLILAVLGQPVLPEGIDREEKILIGDWSNMNWGVSEEDIRLFAEAGMNLMISTGDIEQTEILPVALNACDQYGIEVLRRNWEPSDELDPDEALPLPLSSWEYFDFPAYLGNILYDEPGTEQYPLLAETAEKYAEAMPGKMCYYNLLPMYANAAQLKFGAGADQVDYYDDPELYQKYIDSYAEQIPGDYMSVDIYPNRVSGGKKATYEGYLQNMDIFSSACQEYGRDFWLYVQTTGLDGTRLPDDEDMRWQMYIGLAFGADAFIHFTYGTSERHEWTEAMVTGGEPTPVYYAAQKANLEIMALSDDYVRFESLGAFNRNCGGREYASFDNQYEDFSVLTGIDSDDPLLFGCFEGEGGYAFTVVNMYDLHEEKGASLSFAAADGYEVSAWVRGEKVSLSPEDGRYTLELECAEGVFVLLEKK